MPTRKAITVDNSVVGCCGTLGTKVLSVVEADDLAQIFGALADPARLRMLSMIASSDEVCSCALELPLEKSQPTISHHTRILAAAGAVPERLEAVAHLLSD